jgi:ABC-type dipeptide/oligopeptide/nickel transport system permease component
MSKYVVRRLLLAIPTVIFLTVIVFLMLRLAPGDPVQIMLGLTSIVSEDTVASLRKEWGLDKPVYFQYFYWLKNLAKGNLGRSIQTHQPVAAILGGRIVNTLKLCSVAYIIGLCIAFPVGIISAIKPYSIIDSFATTIALIGVSVPTFWLGLVLIILFSVKLRLLPMAGMGGIRYYVLPSITLGTGLAAGLTRMVRSSLLEVLSQDFITVTRAKGLPEWIIIIKHALKPGLIPILTMLGFWGASMLSGAVLTETVFAWPGMGRLLVDSLLARDYPVTQACILVGGIGVVLVNLLIDLGYGIVDPRIRYD